MPAFTSFDEVKEQMENHLVVNDIDILNGRLVVDTNLGRFTWHPHDKPAKPEETDQA